MLYFSAVNPQALGLLKELQLLKSLVYFEDADKEPGLTLLKHLDWDSVKEKIITEVNKFGLL